MNYLVGNGFVAAMAFGDEEADADAKAVLESLFPGPRRPHDRREHALERRRRHPLRHQRPAPATVMLPRGRPAFPTADRRCALLITSPFSTVTPIRNDGTCTQWTAQSCDRFGKEVPLAQVHRAAVGHAVRALGHPAPSTDGRRRARRLRRWPIVDCRPWTLTGSASSSTRLSLRRRRQVPAQARVGSGRGLGPL